ncbi:MAG: type IX secretion system protein PorQ [Saprospiraceae bacterium]|nr:type IX secretion system protein PorQ [Saprospiraceae bacterium]
MNIKLILLTIIFNASVISAQIGGKHAYEFLNLPASARITALGGNLIGVQDEDVSLALSNPASLNFNMHNRISFSQNFHFAGISNGYVAYGRTFKKIGINAHFGAQYINYGDFSSADIIGTQTGSFSAREMAFVIGASKKVADRIQIGANLKNVFSNLESYSSYGILLDFGLNYAKDSSSFMISFVVKNLGAEITTYNGVRFGTPLDIQIGISKRLKYLPFRFSIIGHQLQNANIRYDDPNKQNEVDIFGEVVKENKFSNTVDNIFRHIIFNGEFMLGSKENLRVRFGYSHLRRKELSLASFRSLAGFSAGFGIKINAFKLDYGLGYHHVIGATNHITISTNLSKFFKKL